MTEPQPANETPEQKTTRLRRMRQVGLEAAPFEPVTPAPAPLPFPAPATPPAAPSPAADSQSTARVKRAAVTTAPSSTGPAEQRRERLVGKVVRGFRIDALLEHDDVATTYTGRQLEPDRQVVLHALSPRLLADGKKLEQLTRDMTALASISHEHLLKVITLTADAPDAGGARFLVTLRPQTQPLRELMLSVPQVPAATATVILRQLARGLLEAHRRGVLHLGITPDVIGLVDGPKIVLRGFGLSRPIDLAAASGPALTAACYAAPELADGSTEIDVRADVYALGALTYELVTGKLPFRGPSAADVLLSRVREPLVPAHERVRSVPPALSALLDRMLARDRDARPESLDAVLADLDRGSAPPPPPATPAPALQPPPLRSAWPPELRLAIAALGVVALLAAALGVGPLRAVVAPQDGSAVAPAELVAERALGRLREETGPAAEWAATLERFAAQHEGTPTAALARKEAAALTKARQDEQALAARAGLDHAASLQREGRLGPALDALRDPGVASASAASTLRETIERDLAARGVAWLPGASCRVGEHSRARTVVTREVYIDRDEVTNALYARFVDETGARAPAAWGGAAPPAALAPLPATGVTLRDATAFAAWRGGSLPTSIDWERAARGTAGATWPWGDSPNQNACNWSGARRGGPLAPGSFPLDVSPEGCRDLAGNVAELVLDPPAAGEQPTTALARGGSYVTRWLASCRGAFFQEIALDDAHPAIGFRCVYTTPPRAP